MCAVQSSPVPGVTVIEAYIYDADGQRVEKGQVSTFSCNMATNGYKAEHAYALGQSGEQITEVDGSGNWLHTNVYAAGKLFASYDQNGNSLNFQLTDWVGTRRVQTNYAGAPEASFQSLPFGSRLISISATDCTPDQDCYPADMTGTPLHFTGKQRDTESGLDYFGARYYSSTSGRFISPDWSTKEEAVPYAKLGDPQTLNLYAYVGNNPLTSIDIDGHRSLAAGSPQGCAGNGSVGCSPSEQEAFTPDANTKAQQQSENVSATGQPATSGHPIDKDAITNYADQHAEPHSLGKCAAYCRRAFEAGGVDTNGHPVDAKDWGPTLLKNGATVVSPDGYKPQKADVAVFAGSDAHPHGHITIYDGKQWVSDFKQNNMSPYRSGTTPSTIYRFPDN